MEFESFEDLRTQVQDHDGVLSIQMQDLRDLADYGRLGPGVCQEISRRLDQVGVAHHPPELPVLGSEWVRLYLRGTAVAELVAAVLAPGEGGDERIRATAGSDAEEKLLRVQAIVCDHG